MSSNSTEFISIAHANLSELYAVTIYEPVWYSLFVFGCIFFYIVSKIGGIIHNKLLNKLQQKSTSNVLFSWYLSGLTHSCMLFTTSYIMIYRYFYNNDDLLYDNHNTYYISLHKGSIILSASFFTCLH